MNTPPPKVAPTTAPDIQVERYRKDHKIYEIVDEITEVVADYGICMLNLIGAPPKQTDISFRATYFDDNNTILFIKLSSKNELEIYTHIAEHTKTDTHIRIPNLLAHIPHKQQHILIFDWIDMSEFEKVPTMTELKQLYTILSNRLGIEQHDMDGDNVMIDRIENVVLFYDFDKATLSKKKRVINEEKKNKE